MAIELQLKFRLLALSGQTDRTRVCPLLESNNGHLSALVLIGSAPINTERTRREI
jgi:hypothetical protein